MSNPACGCDMGIGKLRGRLTIPYCTHPPVEPTPPGPDISDIPEDYHVTPKAFEDQIIATEGEVMQYNLVVKAIPYHETTNSSDGLTIYIAEEVQTNA